MPLIQGMHDAAKRVNPEIIVLCHGGPIAEPDDAAYILERTEGVVGFFGASSMERLPTEVAMTENMRTLQVNSRLTRRNDEQVRDEAGRGGRRFRLGQRRDARRRAEHGLHERSSSWTSRSRPVACHDFHKHPDQDEMIIVKSGRVVQWLEQEQPELGPGDSVYIDKDVVHGSFNEFDETAELQVILAPAMGEGGYELVDVVGRRALGVARADAGSSRPRGRRAPLRDRARPGARRRARWSSS